jgi:hypothetical protein
MRHLKALVGAALALTMAACSNPQFIIHPSSNPTATKTRQQLDSLLETTAIRPLRMGSFMFPNKGEFFRPLIPYGLAQRHYLRLPSPDRLERSGSTVSGIFPGRTVPFGAEKRQLFLV